MRKSRRPRIKVIDTLVKSSSVFKILNGWSFPKAGSMTFQNILSQIQKHCFHQGILRMDMRGVPAVVQQDGWPPWSTRVQVQSLARHSGRCHGCSLGPLCLGSDPWPRNSICRGAAQKEKKSVHVSIIDLIHEQFRNRSTRGQWTKNGRSSFPLVNEHFSQHPVTFPVPPPRLSLGSRTGHIHRASGGAGHAVLSLKICQPT